MAVSIIGPKFYAWDSDTGKPLAFGKVYTYQAGTNTPKATFTTEGGETENANPVILNGAGYADIFLSGSYKIVVKDADDVEVWTSDPVSDPSQLQQEWVRQRNITQVNTTTFTVDGELTGEYVEGVAVRVKQDSGFVTGTVSTATYADGKTTVVLGFPGAEAIDTSAIYAERALVSFQSLPKNLGDRTIYVESVSELIAQTNPKDGAHYDVTGYHAGSSLGGGTFVWDAGSTEQADGFLIFGDSPAGRFMRVIEGNRYSADMAGIRPNMGPEYDCGPAFRSAVAAIDSRGGGTFELTPGAEYHGGVSSDSYLPGLLEVCSNLVVEGNGAKLITDPSVTDYKYSLVRIRWVDNATVRNLELIGNKYYGTGAEHGHGVTIAGGSGITLENVTSRECGGDGLYITAGAGGVKESAPKNVTIRNFLADDCRRQGLSVISVNGLVVDGFTATNISGTAPQAGIDFEPNTPEQLLRGIRMRNIRISGTSGPGIYFWFQYLDETSDAVDLSLDSVIVSGCEQGMRFYRGHLGATGWINIKNLTLKDSVSKELDYNGFSVPVKIEGVLVDTALREPIIIGIDGGVQPDAIAENLTISGLSLNSRFDSTGTYSAGVKLRGENQEAIRNISISVKDMTFTGTGTERTVWTDLDSPISNIKLREEVEGSFTKELASSYTVNPSAAYCGYRITGLSSLALGGRSPSGIPFRVEADIVDRHITLPTGSGIRFSPGGLAEQDLVLEDVGSWVILEQDTEDLSIVRIRDGVGYSFS